MIDLFNLSHSKCRQFNLKEIWECRESNPCLLGETRTIPLCRPCRFKKFFNEPSPASFHSFSFFSPRGIELGSKGPESTALSTRPQPRPPVQKVQLCRFGQKPSAPIPKLSPPMKANFFLSVDVTLIELISGSRQESG